MKPEFLIFLVVCAFTAAMGLRVRKEVKKEAVQPSSETPPPSASVSSSSKPTPSENSQTGVFDSLLYSLTSSTVSSTTAKRQICAPWTPCAWSIYKPTYKFIEAVLTSTYCECSKELACQITEDDKSVSTYVHRCRKPMPRPQVENNDEMYTDEDEAEASIAYYGPNGPGAETAASGTASTTSAPSASGAAGATKVAGAGNVDASVAANTVAGDAAPPAS